MLLIWRWICFYPPRPGNTQENQPITSLKPRIFANTTVTNNKVKDFAIRLPFCSNLLWCKRNELTTNKLSIFLSVTDFANHAKFVFVAIVSCLRISNCNKRIKTTQPSVAFAWRVVRWGKRHRHSPNFYCKYSNVEKKLLWPRKTN